MRPWIPPSQPPTPPMKNWTRKDFLKTSLLGGGAALFVGRTRLAGQTAAAPAIAASGSANGDIRVAVVGFHAQGAGHYKNYLPSSRSKVAGARLVALCD